MTEPRDARSWDEPGDVEQVHRRLTADGILAVLELGGAEEREWADCDLASLAENRLGERLEPRGLDDAKRADWCARATTERLLTPAQREYERCFWLLDQGERVGTVALGTSTLGGSLIRLSSFYVFPGERGRGIGRGAMRRIGDAFGEHGLGIRLETCWTWRRAVRFYLELGMWVRMWKRDLDFWWRSDCLPPIVDFDGDTASLSVEIEGARRVLVRARREDGRLVSFDDSFRDPAQGEPSTASDPRVLAIGWDASSTLSAHLALRGWPLLEFPDRWTIEWHGDGGAPEGLAYRIVCWEAWARKHGWRIDAPRIPGLPSLSWDELEAR